MNEIIEALKEKRYQRNRSQLDLAYDAGLAHDYIARLEKYKIKHPSFDAIVNIAKVLELDLTPFIYNG